MKKAVFAFAVAALALALGRGALADVSVGVHFSSQQQDFYLGLSQVFGVPQANVEVVQRTGLPDDEMPVAFFLARQARVAPAVVVDLRRQGMSWMAICRRFRVSPAVFYVPLRLRVIPAPYGRVYAFYRKPRKAWGRIALTDADVVNMVNLRFAVDRGLKAEDIVTARSRGGHFADIVYEGRHPHPVARERRGERRHERGQDRRDDRRDWHQEGNGRGH